MYIQWATVKIAVVHIEEKKTKMDGFHDWNCCCLFCLNKSED